MVGKSIACIARADGIREPAWTRYKNGMRFARAAAERKELRLLAIPENAMQTLAALIAAAAFVYLLYAIVRPERF